jgi:ABC-type transport system substrate-binding protein
MGYLGAVCEPLFEYHYLKRPLELQPLLAKSVPDMEPITEPGPTPDDPPRQLYRLRFEIHDGVLFHRSVCFDMEHNAEPKTRELTADDIAFTFQRIADPINNCPAYDSFARIDGLTDWTKRIAKLRSDEPSVASLPILELYERIGPIAGVRVTGRYSFDLVLNEKFPLLMYWLAFSIAAPVPPEAVDYFHGREGRRPLSEWPIGTGPYRMVAHDTGEFLAFEKNPDWRGITRADEKLAGTVYPSEAASGDAEAGLLDPAYVGRSLPFIDRFEYRRDKEAVSRFGKFLQGYYDSEEVIEETFNQAVAEGEITPPLAARGIRLNKQTMLRTWYFAFNMDDDIVGAPPVFKDPEREKDRELWLERNRKLRQAMNLAYDTLQEIEIFRNGRATKAETPLPPGLFGFDPDYRNQYRVYDPELTRAKQLMAEAGYPNGIDPATGRPLTLTLSVPDTDARSMELFKMNARQFGQLGIEFEVDAVTYNAFVRKMRLGAFQVLRWGWYADYPDPQTFLLLLYGPERSAGSGRSNKANFADPRYDFLYEKMMVLEDDESATWIETDANGTEREVTMTRAEIVREMLAIFEHECPWIVNHHPQAF